MRNLAWCRSPFAVAACPQLVGDDARPSAYPVTPPLAGASCWSRRTCCAAAPTGGWPTAAKPRTSAPARPPDAAAGRAAAEPSGQPGGAMAVLHSTSWRHLDDGTIVLTYAALPDPAPDRPAVPIRSFEAARSAAAAAVSLRADLRAQGLYPAADGIRDTLTAAGLLIQDTADGTHWTLPRLLLDPMPRVARSDRMRTAGTGTVPICPRARSPRPESMGA